MGREHVRVLARNRQWSAEERESDLGRVHESANARPTDAPLLDREAMPVGSCRNPNDRDAPAGSPGPPLLPVASRREPAGRRDPATGQRGGQPADLGSLRL
jgi:hypothetical protein